MVVSYKLDRMYRSVQGAFEIVEWLDRRGVGYASATQPIDTSSSFGRAILGIFAVFAALERDMILERTAEGKQRVAREGGWPGGPPPFGFRLEERQLLPNLVKLPCGYSEVEIVQLAFRLAAEERLSYQSICDRLTALGIPAPAYCRPLRKAKRPPSTHWRASTLANWFRSTTYIGMVDYGGVNLPVEPLVDTLTYTLARQYAKTRRILCRRGSSTHTYLLKNLIYCTCGHKFHGSVRRYGRPRRDGRWHYACTGKRHHAMLNGKDAPRCRTPERWTGPTSKARSGSAWWTRRSIARRRSTGSPAPRRRPAARRRNGWRSWTSSR
jgi:site-specific DNA recombinase